MQHSGGLTLVELIFGLAVAAVLAGTTVASFQTVTMNARRIQHVNAFVSSTHLARSEAIKRLAEVALCKADTVAQQCHRDDAAGWDAGWLVFVNSDTDSPPHVDPDEPVLRVFPPTRHNSITANRDAFTFRPVGSAATNGTITVCDTRGAAAARAIVVSQTGRPRVASTDASGEPLICPQ